MEKNLEIHVKELQSALNAYEHCENVEEAADELKISVDELKVYVDLAEEEGLTPDKSRTKFVQDGRGKYREMPLSENTKKVRTATRRQCIEELRGMYFANNEIFITRDFFRKNSSLAESAWTQHFGTFQEFKCQAGIQETRHTRQLSYQIAKHASKDDIREFGKQRNGYEGKYLKPSGNRFKTYVACMDVHDKECDPFYRRILMDSISRIQPDGVIVNGDLFDFYEFGKYTQDPREWDVLGRINWVHDFLGEIREISPDSQIDLIEGNHEYRLLRHLAEATPSMQVVLSDLHGFTFSSLMQLDEFEINYIARSELGGFTQSDIRTEIGKNWKVYDEAFLACHFPTRRNDGMAGFSGHHHKHLVWTSYSPIYGPIEWHQCGGGHRRQASYCDGENWGNGFLLAHVDTMTKKTSFEYVDIKDHAVVGGKWYARTPEEYVVNT